ncbi:MAG TPA: hypothetical protein PKA64_11070 [Myxococcota bacterium]|nr:hypothetical protein [Myxococcota bacterium]
MVTEDQWDWDDDDPLLLMDVGGGRRPWDNRPMQVRDVAGSRHAPKAPVALSALRMPEPTLSSPNREFSGDLAVERPTVSAPIEWLVAPAEVGDLVDLAPEDLEVDIVRRTLGVSRTTLASSLAASIAVGALSAYIVLEAVGR